MIALKLAGVSLVDVLHKMYGLNQGSYFNTCLNVKDDHQ